MRIRPAIAVLVSVLSATALAQDSPRWTPPDPATKALARSIFEQLVDINTTDSIGSVTAASKAMQQRFLDAGFPLPISISVAPMTARKIWSSAIAAPESIHLSSSSAMRTLSRRAAPTGPSTPSTLSRKTATSTAAAPRI